MKQPSTPVATRLGTLAKRLLGALLMLSLACGRAADLQAYTTEWQPYSYIENGEVKGISTDILRAACSEAGLSCAITMLPWVRAYATVSGLPDSLLYTTARKPSREKEFLWVGPILPRTTWIYGRAGAEKQFQTLKDLSGARFGVVRGEASITDLAAIGVPESALSQESSDFLVLKMLRLGMVDAMVDTELGMAWNLQASGVSPKVVSRLMKLTDEGAYYFALNLKTNPALRDKLQSALDKLRQSGAIDQLQRKYLQAAKP